MSNSPVTKTEVKKKGPKLPALHPNETFVHNKSRGTFHVPLLNEDPKVNEKPITFELDEIRPVEKSVIEQSRFLRCLDAGFLEVFTPEQYSNHLIQKQAEKAKEVRKETVGNHESGLPNNRTMALQQIEMIDDPNILEALLEKETRSSVLAAIEERLEDLASKGDIVA